MLTFDVCCEESHGPLLSMGNLLTYALCNSGFLCLPVYSVLTFLAPMLDTSMKTTTYIDV